MIFLTQIKGYLISGHHLFRKLNQKELEHYDAFFDNYKEQIEKEIGRRLTKKEERRLYFLILGIINKHNEYDERYHKYLIGEIIQEN